MEVTKLELLPEERQLSKLLVDVATFINDTKQLQPEKRVVLRFAGGWVRDKLLGIESNDIDVAINELTGEDFAYQMKLYTTIKENIKRHSLKPEDLGRFHIIKQNPEKSKQLETTSVKIFGRDVDFVNLRKEIYSKDSRNPEMQFGTPEEDAERRDATINALFYNIHTELVEDFTGGLKDLKRRRITTPLDPETTFNDDPLRVLRLIRFASRLDFEIDSRVEHWMGNAEVAKNFKAKISRERVGIELTKMLKALDLIDRIGLYHTVFTDPTKEVPTPDISTWKHSYTCLSTLKASKTPGSIYDALVRSEDAALKSWVLAALVPWANIQKPDNTAVKNNEPYIADVARRGIAADSKTCVLAAGAFHNRAEIIELKNAINRGDEWDTVGMKIRSWKADWRLHALFTLLVEATSSDTKGLFTEWQTFVDHLEKLDVMEVATQRYPLTGTDLMKALGRKGGPWTSKALDICMQWQLRNPTSNNISEAIEEVKAREDELK